MPEVITDTSPIQYLYQLAQLELLPKLYGQIRVPQIVADELAQGRAQGIALLAPTTLAWITLCPVKAKQSGYWKAITPLLDELGTLNFRLAPELVLPY